MRLTAKERILLYLLETAPSKETVEVTPDLTQEGVAHGSWIDLRHVPQYVRPLLHEGLVRERQAHVRGIRQRRKVYDLTEAGRLVGVRLRERAKAELVRVQDDLGVREVTVSEALGLAGDKTSLLRLLRSSWENGVVDLIHLAPGPPASFVAMLSAAPRIKMFVGRQKELEAVTAEGKGPRIFIVRGVAGIGKSCLAAEACEALRSSRNLYWRRVRTWDTSLSILAGVGDFLFALGRPGLRSVLARGETGRAVEVLRKDLPGTRSFLVFDDAHEASREALGALQALKEALAEVEDVRALILTRRSLSFYDRRDAVLDGLIREIDLEGLGPADSAVVLGVDTADPSIVKVARRFGGHPLILELLRSSGSHLGMGARLADVGQFIEEAVYRDLSPTERKMMRLASLYRTPVPREALFAGVDLTQDPLLSLRERALIRRTGENAFEVHDTIRDYFDTLLVGKERNAFAHFAADQLRMLSSRYEGTGNFAASVDCLSNALQLTAQPADQIALLEALADANERIGDLPEALKGYKEGLALGHDPETAARLHRKSANALLTRGDTGPASKEVDRGLQALGARKSAERGWLELLQGDIAADGEDWDRASSSARSAIQILRKFGEKPGEVEALILLAGILVHEPEGDVAEGERLYQAATQLAASLPDRGLLSQAHGDLVHFYLAHRPDVEKAMAHVAAEESTARDQDAYTRLAAAYWKALVQEELLADFVAAEKSLNDLLIIAHRTYNKEGKYLALHQLANLAYFRDDFPEAQRRFEDLWQESRAASRFDFTWSSEFAFEALWMAAECCLRQGDRGEFEKVAAELEDPEVQRRIGDRVMVTYVLRGLSAFVHGDDSGFESWFSRGLVAAEHSFETQEAPFMFLSYLVPYFYGVALRARDRDEEADSYISRAREVLATCKLKARSEALLRGEERAVQILRRWGGPKPSDEPR